MKLIIGSNKLLYILKKTKNYSILLFLLFGVLMSLKAQEMKKGFEYLESSKYKEAEVFFKKILNDFPNNKTAQLCYGRAVGLNGNAQKAEEIFEGMLQTYPNDFEIELNYAESLLWGKKYENALVKYQELTTKAPNDFAALLGYANTFSNLKKYEDALIYVNKALEVSKNNPNALTSKKYINFGLANNLITDKKYDEAIVILQQNLETFENDRETLLNFANLYLIAERFDEAKIIYEQLATIYKTDEIISITGLSLVSHLQENDKTALKLAVKALEKLSENSTDNDKKLANERYVQALIWNKKYSLAEEKINELEKNIGKAEWIIALKATLHVYLSKFSNSIANYQELLTLNKNSFDGNLGIANSYYAKGNIKNAYDLASNALSIYPKQKDIVGFIEKIDLEYAPFLNIDYSYSFDNGDNIANSISLQSQVPLSVKLKILGDISYRNTFNDVVNLDATSTNFNIGVVYQLFDQIALMGKFGNTSSVIGTKSYNQPLIETFINIKSLRLQNLEIGYRRDLQNFNADLLNREIVQNNIIVNYNINSTFGLGFFGQYYHTFQSDANKRDLVFTSLYYNFLKKPLLKAGINYQYLSFANQLPTIYFSPENFNAIELFATLLKEEFTIKNHGFFYELSAAIGIQNIDGTKQSTYRFATNLGYKLSKMAVLKLYANQSNIASTTAAGFKFTQMGVNFKWIVDNKPLFR